MSNALTTVPKYYETLPDFLKSPDLFASASALVGGISAGTPPQISIKGSKWGLVDAEGETYYVQQMHLDVIVVGANEFVSKTFYEGEYDPNNIVPPTCWSDNGKAPSSLASSPQSPTCASCKNAAFGSKISTRGTKVKACGDSKKLAVVLAAPTPCTVNNAAETLNPFEQVYLLRVPAMSMGPWADYASGVVRKGVPIAGVVIRLSFDPAAEYPKILFNSAALVNDAKVFASYKEKLYLQGTPYQSADTAEVIGAYDIPLSGGTGSAPAAAKPAETPALTSSAVPSAQSSQATATLPAGTAPGASPSEGRPKGRPPKAATASATPPDPFAQGQQQQAGAQAHSGVQNGVIQTPTPATADLDALLAAQFGS